MELMQQNISKYENYFRNTNILQQIPYRQRRSTLIVTLADPEIAALDLQRLIELGINVVRFKMSFSTKEDKIRLIMKLDEATETLRSRHGVVDWPLTTCVELKTSIVKTGLLEGNDEFVIVKEGTYVELTCNLGEFDKCSTSKIFIDNPYLTTDVRIGMKIALGQDEIELQCMKIINKKSIKCLVTRTGQLTNMTSVFISAAADSKKRNSLSKKDMDIVKFALDLKVDMIMVNYARESETLKKIKKIIGKNSIRPILLAGVCTPKGLNNIDDIIKESDGIVFSREHLSYELDDSFRYRILHIQKWACAKCRQAGKPFYISGGVFKKALSSGQICNHEIVDLSNALLDGATGFVLKQCSDVDRMYKVLKTINQLCSTVEPLTNRNQDFWRILEAIPLPVNAAEASAISCAAVAHQSKAKVIIVPTVTGDTVQILLRLQISCIIITVSTNKATTRRLRSYRCVIPLLFQGGKFKNWYFAVEARVQYAVEHAVNVDWLKLGDNYVTLQRCSETSAFCDTVQARNVTIYKKPITEYENITFKQLYSTLLIALRSRLDPVICWALTGPKPTTRGSVCGRLWNRCEDETEAIKLFKSKSQFRIASESEYSFLE